MATQTGSIDLKAVAQAGATAEETTQYFWFNSTDSGAGEGAGAHITETDKATFIADPANGGGNVLIDSDSVEVRDGTTTLAMFGANGAQIGESDGAHTFIDEDGMQIYSVDDNDNLVQLANIGYGNGVNAESGESTAPYYTLGIRANNSANGNYSVAEGNDIVASGFCSHAEGSGTKAYGSLSHAQNYRTVAMYPYQTVIGRYNEYLNDATVKTFTGDGSTVAYQLSSVVQSHAIYVFVNGKFQIQGKDYYLMGGQQVVYFLYTPSAGANIEVIHSFDVAKAPLFIIGNGTSDNARSNALTVDRSGNVELALDTTAASGTDHDLYAAITALGWDSDVIV